MQLRPEFLGLHSLNPFVAYNSPSRSVMFAGNFVQRLVVDGMESGWILAGPEVEMVKGTLAVRMPENGRIMKIVDRYPRSVGIGSVNHSVESLVIYEGDETREIGCFVIPKYLSYHQYFGWKYKLKPAASKLTMNALFKKDTVFADTPAVDDYGLYSHSVPCNVAFMSHSAGGEDGIVVARDTLERFKFRLYVERTIEYGATHMPVNLYGDENNFKAHPDIGEYVREDGLLMALRSYDPDLAPIDLNINDIRKVDNLFDKVTYARAGKGKVIDIKVIRNNNVNKRLPQIMGAQDDRYAEAYIAYNQALLDFEAEINKQTRKKYGPDVITPFSKDLHHRLVTARALTDHLRQGSRGALGIQHRRTPIDEYRVEFVIEYEVTPTIGFKLTDLHGGLI